MIKITQKHFRIVRGLGRFILFAGLLVGVVFLLVRPGLAQKPPASSTEYVPGEVLVKFQPHVNQEAAQRSLQSAGVRVAEVSPYSGVMRIKVEPGHEQEMIDKLLARGDVEFATVNNYVQATVIPNDTYYYYNADINQWALPKIEAPAAWDISTGSSDVIIGVVDSGLDTAHIEFLGRVVSPHDEIDNDSVPQDTCSHGTHVAGIAAAEGNNGVGVAGLAWGVRVMPVRVLNQSYTCSGSEGDIAAGIDWAVSHGARIINLSLGGSRSSDMTCEQSYPAMSDAVQNALYDGVLVVAASGNSSGPVNCPAAMDGVVAVGSTTSSDTRSSFSNYGPELDLAAPGSNILSTVPFTYGTTSGTSMAAPHVSGLAALLWSVSPSLTKDQVRDFIQDNAVDLGTPGWDQYFGHGRINAWKALGALSFQSTPSLTLFVDDDKDQASGLVQVTTLSANVITWTAAISPTVPWLSIASSDSGTITASSSPTNVTLLATSAPITYSDTPTTTTLVVTGTTVSGASLTASSDIQLIYVPEIFEYYFPLMFKN
jgi:thermitase